MTKYPFYVTMTDTFFSGWGHAQGKQNKLIFGCETMDEANIVVANATYRTDQIYIYIRTTKPSFSSHRYYVQWKDKTVYPSWYEMDYFKPS